MEDNDFFTPMNCLKTEFSLPWDEGDLQFAKILDIFLNVSLRYIGDKQRRVMCVCARACLWMCICICNKESWRRTWKEGNVGSLEERTSMSGWDSKLRTSTWDSCSWRRIATEICLYFHENNTVLWDRWSSLKSFLPTNTLNCWENIKA